VQHKFVQVDAHHVSRHSNVSCLDSFVNVEARMPSEDACNTNLCKLTPIMC